jgi:glucose/arabinose dehydrogenase
VGLAFDKHDVLWGVENGADKLVRDDLGGDIHNDNPGEELNRFSEDDAGKHWGYPYCWSEYVLDAIDGGKGKGTIWAWPSFMPPSSDKDDAWCRKNTLPSELSMQAHSAPLGLTFYEWREVDAGCVGTFPKSMDGYLFVAFHGSWNRSPSTGYKVVSVPFDTEGRATGDPIDFLVHDGSGPQWSDGMRPVDVDFDSCGRLLVSSDGSRGDGYKGSKILRLAYEEVTGGGVPSSSGGGGGGGGGGCCGSPSSGHTKSAAGGGRVGGVEMVDDGWLVVVMVLCVLLVVVR